MFEFLRRNRETNLTQPAELPKRTIASSLISLFGNNINLEEIEELLIKADFGADSAKEISQELKQRAKLLGAGSDWQLRALLRQLLTERLTRSDSCLNLSGDQLPHVILVVGVNGAGKTTTIGKLAKWFRDGDWNVVIGAADTFRAGAVEQLATLADRCGVKLIRPTSEGQDPAAVAYITVEQAIADQADLVIIDTAGRLQNQQNLMDELTKIIRAVEKKLPVSEVLLVLDATMGQNTLHQAKAFSERGRVSGVVVTKLDGNSKAGFIYAVQNGLSLPVKLLGTGESLNDLGLFEVAEFVERLTESAKLERES